MEEINKIIIDSESNHYKSFVDYMNQCYNKAIVDKAVEYAHMKIDKGCAFEHDDTMLKLIRDKLKSNGNEDLAVLIDTQLSWDRQFAFDKIANSYADGFVSGIKCPDVDIKPELELSDYVKNKDFCVLFDFGDNDFGGYMAEAAENFCNHYNMILDNINCYSKIEIETANKFKEEGKPYTASMTASYIKDLEQIENQSNIIELMKSLFMSSYLKDCLDMLRCNSNASNNNYLKETKDTIDYLRFDPVIIDEDSGKVNWKVGTWNEVCEYGLEMYKYMQDDDVVEMRDFTKYWLNGEVLVLRVVDGRMVYMVK